jgi:hypothetical protein
VLGDPARPPAVAAVVKRYAAAQLPPAAYAGHSLRASFVASSIEEAPARSGWRRSPGNSSLDTVTVYVRRFDAF